MGVWPGSLIKQQLLLVGFEAIRRLTLVISLASHRILGPVRFRVQHSAGLRTKLSSIPKDWSSRFWESPSTLLNIWIHSAKVWGPGKG